MRRLLLILSLLLAGCLSLRAQPGGIVDLTALPSSVEGEVVLQWTSPNPNDGMAAPSSYLVKSATAEINAADFNAPWVSTYTHAWGSFALAGAAESRVLAGLEPGATLHFALVAIDSNSIYGVWNSSSDTGGLSNTACFTVVFDSTPVAVAGTAALSGNALADIAWTANPETDILSYTIERSTSSPSSDFGVIAAILSPGTTHQDAGLVNGVTHYYRVRANDKTGHSGDYGATVSTVPWVSLGVPSLGAGSVAVSTTAVNWEWQPSANAAGYRVISSSSGDSLSGNLSSGTTFWLQGNLSANTSAAVFLQAFNGLLAANSSPLVRFTLVNSPSDAGSTQAASQIDLFWSLNGNPVATRYNVRRSTDGFASSVSVMQLAAATTCQDSGLREGTTYAYEIRAVNGDNVQSTAVQLTTVTLSVPPAPPNIVLAEPYTNDGEMRLIWDAGGDDGTSGQSSSYVVKWSTSPLDESRFAVTVSSRSVAATVPYGAREPDLIITGLYPGTTFWFGMKAVDDVGNYSVLSNTKTTAARDNIPQPPGALTALAISSSTVYLSWTLPGYTGYDDRYQYRVYSATFPFASYQSGVNTVIVAHPATSFSHLGLFAETTYYYRVSSLDSGDQGNGFYSQILESSLTPIVTVRTPDTTPPGRIVALTALPGSDEGRVWLRWTSPGDDGYAGAIANGRFRVDYSTDALKAFQYTGYRLDMTTNTAPGSDNIIEISGLSGGATYYFRLWTADESMNWSAVSDGATTWAQVDITAPGQVTNLAASAAWRRSTLSWTSPGDDGYAGAFDGTFEIRASTSGPISNAALWDGVPGGYPFRIVVSTSVASGAPVSRTVTGLANDTTYYFALRYYDERGNQGDISTLSPSALPTNQVPGPFALSLPPDQAISPTLWPTFTWTPSSDADTVYGDRIGYALLYSTDVAFPPAVTVTSANIAGTSYTPPLESPLLEDRVIYWKVEASDLDGTAVVTSTFSLRINSANTAPSAFNLIAPPNGAIIATAAPLLSWGASNDPDPGDIVSYRVDYSLSANFQSFTSSAGILATSFTPPTLAENATYWWRVWAMDDAVMTLCGTTYYFRVNELPEPPAAFSHLSPADNVILTTTVVTFSWQGAVDPDPGETATYDFSWSTFIDFSSSVTVSGLAAPTTSSAGFSENGIYYWRVSAVGPDGQRRPSGQTWRFYVDMKKELPGQFELTEPGYGVLISTTITPLFSWTRAIDPDPADDVRYIIDLSPNPNFAGLGTVAIDRGTDRYYVPLIGLADQTTYYWRVRASGYQGSPLPQQVDPDFTFSSTGTFIISMTNNPPNAFSLLAPASGATLTTKKPKFVWGAALDEDVGSSVSYSIVISSRADFSVVFASAAGITGGEYSVPGAFLEDRQYYWKVTALDNKGASSECSGVFSFAVPVITVPQAPGGLTGSLSGDRLRFTLSWNGVLRNTDGSAIDDLAGYAIYRGLSIEKMSRYVAIPSTQTSWSDENTDGGNFYYRIRSFDTSGVESAVDDSPVISSLSGNVLTMMSSDRVLAIEIPQDVASYLRAGNNEYGTDLRIRFESVPGDDDAVVARYRIRVESSDGTNLERLSFSQPLTLTFSYAAGTPAAARLAASPGGGGPENLGIFWHNGMEYLRIGGVSNARDRSISVKAIAPGEYQLRRVAFATVFRLASVNPPKLFTPNIPPYERITFYIDNPEADKVIGKVFDLRGEFIADLRPLNDPTATSVIFEWDGQGADRTLVPKGVYLYQIEGSGKVVNGTVIVAR